MTKPPVAPKPEKKRTWWKSKPGTKRADAARIAATHRAQAKGTFSG